MLKSANPEIKRLLGEEGEFGKGIGLDNDWAYRIIKTSAITAKSSTATWAQHAPQDRPRPEQSLDARAVCSTPRRFAEG